MAKDLVRTRNYIKKFYLMKANIQAISLKLQVTSSSQLGYSEPWCELCVCVVFCSQTMRSQAAMAKAMKGVSKVGDGEKGVTDFSVSMFTVVSSLLPLPLSSHSTSCLPPLSTSHLPSPSSPYLPSPSFLHFHLPPLSTSCLSPSSTLLPGDGKDELPAEAS